MKPFMQLAETIGAMTAQLNSSSKVTQVVLKTMGGRDANITTKQARQLLEAQVSGYFCWLLIYGFVIFYLL